MEWLRQWVWKNPKFFISPKQPPPPPSAKSWINYCVQSPPVWFYGQRSTIRSSPVMIFSRKAVLWFSWNLIAKNASDFSTLSAIIAGFSSLGAHLEQIRDIPCNWMRIFRQLPYEIPPLSLSYQLSIWHTWRVVLELPMGLMLIEVFGLQLPSSSTPSLPGLNCESQLLTLRIPIINFACAKDDH